MVKIIKRYADFTAFAVLVFFALVLVFVPSLTESVLKGVNLFVACVFPSLFPYLFVTALLTELKTTEKISTFLSPVMKKLFNVNGVCGYAFFVSTIAGFPMGAKLVSDLKTKGLLSQAESVRASALCSTSSPVFLIASVGSVMFNNRLFGILLFFCNVASAIIVGLIFSHYRKNRPTTEGFCPKPKNADKELSDCVFSAIQSSFFVGAVITLFYVFTEILLNLGLLNPLFFVFEKIFGNSDLSNGLTLGLFECTKGLKAVSNGGITFLTLPVCALICGFGGISVIVQSTMFLKKAKIKTAPFVISKTLSAVINFALGLALSFIFF